MRIKGVIMDSKRDLFEALKVLAPSAIPKECKAAIEWNEDDQMYIDNGHNDGRCKCGCQDKECEEREEELQVARVAEWDIDEAHELLHDFSRCNKYGLKLYTWPCCSKLNNKKWIIGQILDSTPDVGNILNEVSVVEKSKDMSSEKQEILLYFGDIKIIFMLNDPKRSKALSSTTKFLSL